MIIILYFGKIKLIWDSLISNIFPKYFIQMKEILKKWVLLIILYNYSLFWEFGKVKLRNYKKVVKIKIWNWKEFLYSQRTKWLKYIEFIKTTSTTTYRASKPIILGIVYILEVPKSSQKFPNYIEWL